MVEHCAHQLAPPASILPELLAGFLLLIKQFAGNRKIGHILGASSLRSASSNLALPRLTPFVKSVPLPGFRFRLVFHPLTLHSCSS